MKHLLTVLTFSLSALSASPITTRDEHSGPQPCFAGADVPAWNAFAGGWQWESWEASHKAEWDRVHAQPNQIAYQPGQEQRDRERGKFDYQDQSICQDQRQCPCRALQSTIEG